MRRIQLLEKCPAVGEEDFGRRPSNLFENIDKNLLFKIHGFLQGMSFDGMAQSAIPFHLQKLLTPLPHAMERARSVIKMFAVPLCIDGQTVASIPRVSYNYQLKDQEHLFIVGYIL